MAGPKGKKVIPKSQKELEQERVGSPKNNNLDNPSLRANNISLDKDDHKPFSLGIEDIDQAIFYYFKNIIKPFVMQNGVKIDIPIEYADPERWKSMQRDGLYRDKMGAVMSPLILCKRNSLVPDNSIGNKLDANFPYNYQIVKKKYSQKNTYSHFNLMNNKKPVEEYYVVVIPDYITLDYTCVIFTYYNSQMNGVIEAINYASNSYWGDKNGAKFKTKISSFDTVTEISEGSDRIIKTTFKLEVRGHIIPDNIQKDLSALKKIIGKNQINISFGEKSVDVSTNTQPLDINRTSINYGGNNGSNTDEIIKQDYLNFITTLNYCTGSLISSDQNTSEVMFYGVNKMGVPIGLIDSQLNNFNVFLNGLNVEKDSILSLEDEGNNIKLLLDNNKLNSSSPLSEIDFISMTGKFRFV